MNKTVLGWNSLFHHCRNLSNRTCNYLIRGFTCGAAVQQWKSAKNSAVELNYRAAYFGADQLHSAVLLTALVEQCSLLHNTME